MLKDIIAKKRCSFHEEFQNWEEAIEAACKPLVVEGVVMPEYIEAIIQNVKEYGPYIVIAPNICIPHAQEGKGVNDTAICFMRTKKPVHFSENTEQDARLFFVLASTDNNVHLKNLSSMVEFISDEDTVEKLLQCESIEDLKLLL